MTAIKRTFIASCIILSSSGWAQSYTDGVDNFQFHSQLTLGFNTDGFEPTISFGYYPIEYLGIRATLGFPMDMSGFSNIVHDIGEIIVGPDYYYDDYYNYNNDYISRFTFSPSIEFRTPKLVSFKKNNLDFRLFAAPGLCIATPPPHAHNANWAYWQGEGGILANIENLTFTLGYKASNFYLYDGCSPRDIKEREGYITHTVYFGIGYSF